MKISPVYSRLLRAASECRGWNSPAEAAKNLGISEQRLTNWKTRGVSKQGVLQAAHIIGCSAIWLETGNGAMSDAVKNLLSQPINGYQNGVVRELKPKTKRQKSIEDILNALEKINEDGLIFALGSIEAISGRFPRETKQTR